MVENIVKVSKSSSQNLAAYNLRQKRIWALTAKDLQKYINFPIDWKTISRENLANLIPLNEHYNYVCELDVSFVDKNHSDRVEQAMFDLRKIAIKVNDGNFKGEINLFNSVKKDLKTGKFYAGIGVESLRWILDFGQKRNFTLFNIDNFLPLSSTYSQELLLLLSEFYKQGEFVITIENLKKRLGCPNTTDTDYLKRRVFEPAKKEFESVPNGQISFTYEFSYIEDDIKRLGRKGYNAVKFTILEKNK